MTKDKKLKNDPFIGKEKKVEFKQGKAQLIALIDESSLSDADKVQFKAEIESLKLPEGPLVLIYHEATIPSMNVSLVTGRHGMVAQIDEQLSSPLLSPALCVALAQHGRISGQMTTLLPAKGAEYMHIKILEAKTYFFTLKDQKRKVIITFNAGEPLKKHNTPKVLFGRVEMMPLPETHAAKSSMEIPLGTKIQLGIGA